MAPAASEFRPDPDALIAGLDRARRGRLKIFLGAAPGVGKTWEMLEAANLKRESGTDVVAGLIETHGRAGTIEKIGALDILPRRQTPYRDQKLEEFDLDAALARKPALLLIDELAHTNAPGLRHEKRWQDVEEILAAGGIDVWTTMNVQHLESLNDPIARITGIRVAETIPDTVLDMADEIELVDLPPAELRMRLAEGHVYRPDVAARALAGFFREGNLGALREMALRRVAQRVDKDVTSYMRARAIPGPWPASERVLALVGPDASAENVVRHAARLADALRAPMVAFHVEGPEDNAHVQSALNLAVQLGGAAETTTTGNPEAAVLDYAGRHNITHIVIGRAARRRWWFSGAGLGDALTRKAQAFTLHFVPVPAAAPPRAAARQVEFLWRPYAVIALVLAAVTMAGIAFRPFIPQEAMGLIFTAIITGAASRWGRGAGIVTAALGFLLWNFFFLAPFYTFSVGDPQEAVALIVFLAVGMTTGTLAGRVRMEAGAATARIEALRRISLFGQKFSRAATEPELLHEAAAEAAAIAQEGVVMLGHNGVLAQSVAVPAEIRLDDAAHAAADWAFNNAIETGLGTATLPGIPWRFMPLRAAGHCIGVLGARPDAVPPPTLVQMLAALADQTAMALERLRLTTSAAQTSAKEDSQRLRTALLSSLSHDLRTPLTAIRGAAETLAGAALDEVTQRDLLDSISQDAARMTKFLANITEMARVETGEINPKRQRVQVNELIEGAISRVSGALYTAVNVPQAASYVLADPTLLEQVMVNLLDNAVKYAPPGSRIAIAAKRLGGEVELSVADEGVGIPVNDLDNVFDSFFRARHGDRVAPGTGLGLAIAKAFTEAMGGRIRAQSPRLDLAMDAAPGTMIFVTLPAA